MSDDLCTCGHPEWEHTTAENAVYRECWTEVADEVFCACKNYNKA